jgi:hypothetical protein
MVVEFQQAIHRDLLIAARFFAKFNMDYLARMDFKARMEGYEIGIRARVLRPSECRVNEDMNPDQELDRLSAADHRPGTPKPSGAPTAASARARSIALASAERVVRREIAAIVKASEKYARSAAGFTAWARQFYRDHEAFVATAMGGLDPQQVSQYCEGQCRAVEAHGLSATALWEREVPPRLAALALGEDVAA